MRDPVRMECRPLLFGLEACDWTADDDVVSAEFKCTDEVRVLSRNMDDRRAEHPWRLTRFDRETEEPVGHSYGATQAEALKKMTRPDSCRLKSFKTKKPTALAALPRHGRIPLATAKSALKRLGRKAKVCGITPAALREGMEVEREHRDVTRGGVLKTAKIAAAHLCEDGRYYRALKTMERKLKNRSR